MSPRDTLAFAAAAAWGTPLRTALMILAMAIGVAAVVALTALGEGARRYVVGEFSALGSNLVVVLPGRTNTGGIGAGSLVTSTPRDLTVEDALALLRAPLVTRVAPLSVGNSEISVGGMLRETLVLGTTADFAPIRHYQVAEGRFLPPEDPRHGSSVAVVGDTIRRELFGSSAALGKLVRIGDRRVRIIGVLPPSSSGLGLNADETVIIPVTLAQGLLNSNTLFRILVEVPSRQSIPDAKSQILKVLKDRHDGEEDVTLISQDAVLGTFDRILTALTVGVASIGAISLVVAGILVMNVMLVAVTQRTAEVGLLKALGARDLTIRALFLAEAALLSMAGAAIGVLLGHFGAWGIRVAYPALPAWPPPWAVVAGIATALVTGLTFGVWPAARAARMKPVTALATH
ncbi:MAG: ABC transporter permease [Zoogloeaceae bacterium]|nr:ABC transporter permease [Zoogloeaceae bacterium]